VRLWPVPLPAADGRRNAWHDTARIGAELATRRWIRLAADMSAGHYATFEGSASIPDPEWPDLTFQQLCVIAFRDRFVASLDHPLVKRLHGLI
jgi:hypothetical protein